MTIRNNFNTLLRYVMLTNQYLVDQYANEHRDGIGQLVTLPSSFTGGSRYLHARTVQGVVYNTYQVACKAMGLMEDDSP